MSFAEKGAAFRTGIQELTFDEIEVVNGGDCGVTLAVIVCVALIAAAYYAGRSQGPCG